MSRSSQKLPTLEQVRKEVYKRNIFRYVAECVKIEDRDSEEIAVPFEMWDEQKNVLKAFMQFLRIVVLKARQLGLTWLALAYASHMIVFFAGKQVVALSWREDPDAKEMVRRMKFILRHLPEWLILEKTTENKAKLVNWRGLTWDGQTLKVVIHHPDGEDSVFQAMAASPSSGRSFTANLIILDEWAFHPFAQEIWTSAYPIINRPTGGQVIGLSTGKIGTLYEETWKAAVTGENMFHSIFLPWWSDPRRTAQWYDQTKRDLPKTHRAEYPATPEEAFTVGEGAAFDEWDKSVHVPYGKDWYPPASWKIIRSYDGAYRQACCKWYAISPDGWAVCYREYYPKKVIDPEQAEAIRAMSRDPKGAPEYISYTVADTSCWSAQPGSGESTADIFARHGIPMIKADKDRIIGWRRLHQWLRPFEDERGNLIARIRFTEACSNTIRTYPSLEELRSNPEDVADGEDHAQDCDRYFVMSRPMPKPSESELAERRRQEEELRRKRNPVTGY